MQALAYATDSDALRNKGIDYYHLGKYDSAILMLDQAILIDSIEQNELQLAKDFHEKSRCLADQGKVEEALSLYQRCINLYEELEQDNLVSTVYGNRADILANLGNYDLALEEIQLCLDFLPETYTAQHVNAYNILAKIYRETNDLKKALFYHRKAISAGKNSKNDILHRAYNNLGYTYSTVDQLDSALYYYDLTISTLKSDKFSINLGLAYINKSDVLYQQRKYQQANRELTKSGKTEALLLVPSTAVILYNDKARLHLALGNHDSTIYYLAFADAILSKNNFAVQQSTNYELHKELALQKNDIDGYKKYDLLLDRHKEKILNEKTARSIALSKIQYTSRQKSDSLALKEQQLEIKNLTISKQRSRLWVILVVLGLIIITSLALLKAYFDGKRHGIVLEEKNKKLAEQSKRIESLSHDLSHRTSNNLEIVKSLLRSLQQKHNNISTIEIAGRIDALNAINRQLLYQEKQGDKINLTEALNDLTDKLSQLFDSKHLIIIHDKSLPVYLNINLCNNICVLVNELVTNSIKHAFKPNEVGKIEIALKKEDDNVFLSYSDNGKGITSNNKGFGMSWINGLLQQMHAKGGFLPSEKGTMFEIIIALQND